MAKNGKDTLARRIEAEMADRFDEELEMEIDDARLEKPLDESEVERDGFGMDRRFYFKELSRLQTELVKLQDWVVATRQKVVVIFEGRDAAGKGGVIKRITQRLSPRVCRVAALPAPSERERSQWYFERYVAHLPAGGEIVLFDRSWYDRAGVERVMGFCTEAEVDEFFRTVPEFEKMLIRSDRKLSPMDLESRWCWERYTRAKEEMLQRTHIPEAPWYVVEAVDKKKARLNCIRHLLEQIPYQDVRREPVRLPGRERAPDYARRPIPKEMYVADRY
ncbi:MAG: polyphosphate kinase 2 [Rhodospirillaceae bacterium]|nr:polyphosphate kinase 2 [Rhodospirillaceae bacterium]